MGTRGPVGKRSEERHRRNAPAIETKTVTVEGEVKVPPENREWHPLAKRLWRAMKVSGQSRFYEPTDWAFAYLVMDDLSEYKKSTKRSAQMLQTIMSSMTSLLLTEGDRRRLQIELNRGGDTQAPPDDVAVMDKWRQKLG